MYKVLFVPAQSIDLWWPQLRDLLLGCPETWNDYETTDSIYTSLESGFASLVIVVREGSTKIEFAAIFQVRNYTEARTVHIFWCSGKNIDRYAEIFCAEMELMAAKMKIDWVEFGPARRGLEPFMAKFGYGDVKVIMRKKIELRTLQ